MSRIQIWRDGSLKLSSKSSGYPLLVTVDDGLGHEFRKTEKVISFLFADKI